MKSLAKKSNPISKNGSAKGKYAKTSKFVAT